MDTEKKKLLLKVERLTAALDALASGLYPRVSGEYEDQCVHEVYISSDQERHECARCMAAYAKKVADYERGNE